MNVQAITTEKITAGSTSLTDLLGKHLKSLSEGSVVAITSKVVSLCENSAVPVEGADKEKLIRDEADYYMPAKVGKYGYHFTIKNNTLIAMSGIDESNGNGNFVLWPKDPQKTANEVRAYLRKKHNLKNLGIIITDSISMPLRYGISGTALAYSGFQPLDNYIGKPDLFGRPFKMSRASIVMGLAATANLVMGEGHVPTPIAVMEDMSFVKFQEHDPTAEELESIRVPIEEDIYEPLLNAVEWKKGGSGKA